MVSDQRRIHRAPKFRDREPMWGRRELDIFLVRFVSLRRSLTLCTAFTFYDEPYQTS